MCMQAQDESLLQAQQEGRAEMLRRSYANVQGPEPKTLSLKALSLYVVGP